MHPTPLLQIQLHMIVWEMTSCGELMWQVAPFGHQGVQRSYTHVKCNSSVILVALPTPVCGIHKAFQMYTVSWEL